MTTRGRGRECWESWLQQKPLSALGRGRSSALSRKGTTDCCRVLPPILPIIYPNTIITTHLPPYHLFQRLCYADIISIVQYDLGD